MVDEQSSEVWYADDTTGCGTLHALHSWWERLTTLRPGYGYHPNGSKTWIIVKEGLQDTTTSTIAGPSMQMTTQGKHHLGAALGTQSFVK